MIPLSRPILGAEEKSRVCGVLDSGWIAAGEEVSQFEKEFAQYVGVKYAIFTNSCTAALKMAYKYFKEEGFTKYHLLEPNTYCATYSAADETGLIRSNKYYQGNLRVVVHFGGVKQNLLCHLEDSAHRIEPNDPLIGMIRCYSFYATKNMTTGHGGMFVTNNKDIYERARLYWKDGLSTSTEDRIKKSCDYTVLLSAGGYDGNDIAASIGRIQLKKLPMFTEIRNRIVKQYNEAFNKDWVGNHIYPYSKDKGLIEHLLKYDIRAGLFYPPNGFVCLPLYPTLTIDEQEFVISKVKEYKS